MRVVYTQPGARQESWPHMGGASYICRVVFSYVMFTLQIAEHNEFYYDQPYVEGGGAQTRDITKQRLRR